MSSGFRATIIGCIAAISYVGAAQAGVIRHDTVMDSQYTSLGANSLYDSVGQVRFTGTDGKSYAASAIMIAPTWALTAAHVVDSTASLDFTLGDETYGATNWLHHSKWDGDLGKGYDIGLIEFAGIQVADDMIATLYDGNNELGKLGTFVGYGTTGTGLTGYDPESDLDKRAGQNMVDAFLRTPGKQSRVLLADFDKAGDPSESSWGDDTPVGLEYLIAPGDSGGGLFQDIGGTNYLTGIHSFGWGILDGNPNSDYGDASGHTRVSSFYGWINDIIGGASSGDGGNDKGGRGGGKKPKRGAKKGDSIRGGNDANLVTMTAEIPEPGTLTLFGLGLVGLGWARRRFR